MRIPKGNFGNVIAQPKQVAGNAGAIGAAVSNAGQALMQIGQQAEERAAELNRAKAASTLLDFEYQLKTKETQYRQRIATGELNYAEARQQFDEELGAMDQLGVNGIDPATAEAVKRGSLKAVRDAQLGIDTAVAVAEQRDLQSQGLQQLDTLGKIAGEPGADLEQVNSRAESLAPLLRRGGLTEAQASRTIQDFKDRNWLNQATQRAMQAKEDLNGLKQLEHDLTADDGFYQGKLDTDKRNAVLNQVINSRLRIENQLEQLALKRDSRAARTMNDIERQIASGVPATAEMWGEWEHTIRGSTYEGEFRDLLQDERHVQATLRLPVDQQLKFVQEREAALLAGGGSVREAANVARLKNAVQANVKLMQEAPLVFNANRVGEDVEPLDLTAIMDPEQSGQVAAQIRERMLTLGAMRKQYGEAVPLRPLLPQEAQAVTTLLNNATPKEQSQLFATLYSAVGDVAAFKGAMQQIAPDAPVKAIAGLLTAKQAELTTAKHWFKPDEIAYSGDVAATLLQGEAMLNASKADQAANGKPNSKLFLPETNTLQADFQDRVGSAFSGRPGAADVAFQAVKAYYVGRAAQTGRIAASNKDIDTAIVQEAITATLGSVVDFNGNGEVLAPWGMDKATFINKATAAMVAAGRANGLPDKALNAFGASGLRNAGENTYYVVQGRSFVTGADGQPIVITVTP